MERLSDKEKDHAKKLIKIMWDSWTPNYHKRHKISTDYVHYGLGCPTEDDLHLLGNVKNKKIIELGCGGGQISIALAKKGAICLGVDFSEEQIKYARNLAEKNNVKVSFVVGDIENLDMVEDESQDVAVSAYAFGWIQHLDRAFKETYRVLKKGGIFVFSVGHPFSNIFWKNDGTFDKEFKVQRSYFLRVDTEGLVRYSSHILEDLVNELINSNFILRKILEPEPVEEKIARMQMSDPNEEYPLEQLKLVPGTIIFKAQKNCVRV